MNRKRWQPGPALAAAGGRIQPVARLARIARHKQLRAAVRDFLLEHHVPALLRRGGEEPATRVAMFHMGRCGSTVLGEMLGAQGEIFWAGEIFEDMPGRYGSLAREPQAVERILRRSMGEPFSLRSLVRADQYPRHYRMYAFETKYLREQHLRPGWIGLDLPNYLALLDAHRFDRFIVLHRHNYLRMLVSRAVGRSTGTWHSRAPAAGPAQVELPVANFTWGSWHGSLLECLRDLDAQYARLCALLDSRQVLHLTYEEHISADPTVAYRAVCGFLGLQAPAVAMHLRKTNPFPLQQSVRNWDEVVGALSDSEFAWMLTHEQPPPAA